MHSPNLNPPGFSGLYQVLALETLNKRTIGHTVDPRISIENTAEARSKSQASVMQGSSHAPLSRVMHVFGTCVIIITCQNQQILDENNPSKGLSTINIERSIQTLLGKQ